MSEGDGSDRVFKHFENGKFIGNLKAELSNTAFVIREVKNLQESSTMYACNLSI